MARKGGLTEEALVALGAEKLARLIMDEASRNAPFKRLVKAALAGAKGGDAIASVVDRRLAALEKARSFIGWERRKEFTADLKATLAVIVGELAAADPAAAIERVLRFLAMADRVFERVDDSSGAIQAVYQAAAESLPDLAGRLSTEQAQQLASSLVPSLLADDYGLVEGVMAAVVTHFDPTTLMLFDRALAQAVEDGRSSDAKGSDWRWQARRDRMLRARQDIADRRGDVDAFIMLESERGAARRDSVAVARRLLAAGRASEALDWVRRPVRPGLRVMGWHDLGDGTGGHDLSDDARLRLEIEILEAKGDRDEAQELRWRTFETRLDAKSLRDYVARLPDFAEFEVLDRAFAHVSGHAHHHAALAFFIDWPRLDLAARLVLDRKGTWDGRHFGLLAPAAEALEATAPAAATVLYRALVTDILDRARAPAYGHAARYLARLQGLGDQELSSAGLPEHAHFMADVKKAHGRKASFWDLVKTTS